MKYILHLNCATKRLLPIELMPAQKTFHPNLNFATLLKVWFFYLYRMSEISIGDAIRQFLRKSKLKTGIQALQIEEVWEKLMGKTIAKYTEKIQIVNHTLFIQTS